MKEVSVWAYPWDLHDLGPQAAWEAMRGHGATGVSLATSYHAGRFLQPGNPRRRSYFPQDGTVYYRVDPARWAAAGIAPLEADCVAAEGDMLARLCALREGGGPMVSCWTVCLHNTRLGMANPGHVVRSALGDPAFYGLCPSSPAARAYARGLVAEISERYRPDRIEIESPDFMGWDHGFHHEKDGLGLLPEERFLLGLCFCDHCLGRAAAAGVPAEAARAEAAALLSAAFSRELPESAVPEFADRGVAAFGGALATYLAWREEPVTSLLAELREATHPATRVLLIDFPGSWWGGVAPLAKRAVDGVVHCVYTLAPAKAEAELARVRAEAGPEATVIAGFQMFHPAVACGADFAARVAAVAPHVDGINAYNLGLVPRARLGWIGRAMRGLSA